MNLDRRGGGGDLVNLTFRIWSICGCGRWLGRVIFNVELSGGSVLAAAKPDPGDDGS